MIELQQNSLREFRAENISKDRLHKRNLTLSNTYDHLHHIERYVRCRFTNLSGGKLTFYLILFVKRIQNNVQVDIIRDAK